MANPLGYASFTFKDVWWHVRLRSDWTTEYRDAAHLGGPWSLTSSTLGNTSIDHVFRRKLRDAEDRLVGAV